MTGFGQASHETPDFEVRAEVKTVNSKFADISMRLPSLFAAREIEVRRLLQQLVRGKINLSLHFTPRNEALTGTKVNVAKVSELVRQLQTLHKDLQLPDCDFLGIAMRQPDALITEVPEEWIENCWPGILQCIQEALESCKAFRLREGEDLKAALLEYKKNIEKELEVVSTHDPERLKRIRQRLEQLQGELGQQKEIDPNRLEQEMLYFAEKLDITEEKVRLESHLTHFEKALEGKEVGKKLNFIAQEMGREINTIGSKANDATIQQAVVRMKEALDKIKEQSLNIL